MGFFSDKFRGNLASGAQLLADLLGLAVSIYILYVGVLAVKGNFALRVLTSNESMLYAIPLAAIPFTMFLAIFFYAQVCWDDIRSFRQNQLKDSSE